MQIHETSLPGVKLLELNAFSDDRGYFKETFRGTWAADLGLVDAFVQDNVSRSYQGTIRGLHYQKERPQAKLVQCISGRILDVAVDLRKNSSTFGQYYSVVLSEKNHKQLYIPEGFAHGFSVLSETAVVCYKCDAYYNKEAESGIHPLDRSLNIDWGIPTAKQRISPKDLALPSFNDFSG